MENNQPDVQNDELKSWHKPEIEQLTVSTDTKTGKGRFTDSVGSSSG